MRTLSIELENCYGIGSLVHEFDFSQKKSYAIYAPNGFMKTSLSKTFLDLSAKGRASVDLIYPERETKRKIKDEAENDLAPEECLVLEPYNESFSSEKTSLLLVNREIKKQYDEALSKIEGKKDDLLKKLKQRSGLTGRTNTPESELLKYFDSESIYELLDSLEASVFEENRERLALIVYCELFNDKTLPFLQSGQISQQLEEYIAKFDQLIDDSPILSKSFNHYHARTINRNLADNGFFNARHSVNLFDGRNKEEITTAEELEAKIEREKSRILSDEELSKKFEAIDSKLTTKELRQFRDYLLDNKDIVAELGDFKRLQKDLWLAYLSSERESYLDFIHQYRESREVVKKAVQAAQQEKTEWEEVVRIFSERFSVPFTLTVSNQKDVILEGSRPEVSFGFKEDEEPKPVEKNLLLSVLSQGERRALYILNILFEITARKKEGLKTLIIADDIADSFDYKNKYAIVEFLKEVSQCPSFYCIFLSHNFDFYRTISSRLNIEREQRLFASRNGRSVFLHPEKYQKNPFEYWKGHLNENRFAISSIPFFRNLAEYCGKNDVFNNLTSLLHIKPDTFSIPMKRLEALYKDVINQPKLFLSDQDKPVINVIFELAEEIVGEGDEQAELESKIVLSIAIRLAAEEFMIQKIQDPAFVESITCNQTAQLLERFKSDFEQDKDAIALLGQVNLMTPENIHLNSFMYEPILDMSPKHLKKLYVDIKRLKGKSMAEQETHG